MAVSRKPPVGTSGVLGWLKTNLFSSVVNSIISVVVGVFAIWVIFGLINWVLFSAHWMQIWVNLQLLAVYRYPGDLLWRPLTVVAMIMFVLGVSTGVARHNENGGEIIRGVFWSFSGLVFLLTLIALFNWQAVRWLWVMVSGVTLVGYGLGTAFPALNKTLAWLWGAALLLGVVLLSGFTEQGPLEVVSTRDWGGFMLTLILSAVGIVVSFPLGIALALGRRSKLPAIKYFCIAFIEIVRGAPLISWLFIASLMVPLILNISPDRLPALMRALVAITLFSSAYMAENVRGGLQAVPKGQSEAARALGLSGWQTTRLIVLPQALKAVIPAIVGQAIGLFKDTSLVFIVGLLDFFDIGRRVIPNQEASLQVTGGIVLEVSLFMAVVYFFFAYRMSVASRQLEKQLGVGER